MKKLLVLTFVAIMINSCGDNQNSKKTNNISNKEKAVALLKAIETGASEPIGYVNAANYKQHNLSVEDGLDGFGRAFEDGDFVVCHTDYNFFGPKAGFDIFRFEDGKIVEHWDNLMVYDGAKNPSGHTPFDGTTEFKDFDKTEANKMIVKNFVQDVLMSQHPENLTNYFNGNNYIQHNTAIADGLDCLGAALAAMAEQGIKMEYFTIHKILGCDSNTPTIIKLPFMQQTLKNPDAIYATINLSEAFTVEQIKERSIVINADIATVLE